MRVLRRAVPVLLPSGANTSVSPLSGFRAGTRCTDETSVYFRQVLGMIPFLWKTMCRPAPWKRRSVEVSGALPGEPGSYCRRSYFRTRPVRTSESPV